MMGGQSEALGGGLDFLPLLPVSDDEGKSSLEHDRSNDTREPAHAAPVTKKPNPVIRTFAPWFKKPASSVRSLQPIQRLNVEILNFIEFISPTMEEHHARSEVVRRITAVVDDVFNTKGRKAASVHVFGSFETRLYLPSSDIDIVVEWETDRVAEADTKPPLTKLAAALIAAGIAEPGRCKTLMKARIPIIKLTDRATNYPVDISFNTKGVEGVLFVGKLTEEYPAVKPLVLLLKQFLEQRSLNEPYTGGIGSYALICMLVSFFQMHPLIQGDFIRPRDNLGVLLMDFLELYGRNFNYDTVGISVLHASYFDKTERGWHGDRRNQLAIEDPQNVENDLCKSSFAYNSVRQAFEHAFNMLLYVMKHSSPEESLLAPILNISDDTLRHRFYIEQTTNI